MNTATDNTTNQDLPKTEEGSPRPTGNRIQRFFRWCRHGSRSPEDQKKLWWFVPATLAVWLTYYTLMLALGGRNPGYGSGWRQWNYMRWIFAPWDISPYPRMAFETFCFFFLYPMGIACGNSLSIFLVRSRDRATGFTLCKKLFWTFFWTSAMLVLGMSENGMHLRFWWSMPHTVMPIPAVRMFEVATIAAWFTFPFLVYWLTVPAIQRYERWHSIQETRALEEAHARYAWLYDAVASLSPEPGQAPPADVVSDSKREEDSELSATRRHTAWSLSIVLLALCLALSVVRILTPVPAASTAGTWTRLPLASGTICGLAVDPLTPTTVYAATWNSWMDNGKTGNDMFRSTDGGKTWSQLTTGSTDYNIRCIAADPTAPSALYAGTYDQGVIRSTDGGATWTAAGLAGKDVSSLAVDPVTPSTLYASVRKDVFPLSPSDELFRSLDRGKTWTAVGTGFADALAGLVIDSTDHSVIYACTWGAEGIYRSADSGKTWTGVDSGLRCVVPLAFAVDPLNPTTMYVGTYGGDGVIRSTDAGRTWMPIGLASGDATKEWISRGWPSVGVDVDTLAINPIDPTILYAGRDDAIYRYDAVPSAK